ncbi:TerL, partial [human gut metagenome]
MDHVYYPINWREKWPDYYNAMNKYQREGKNKHDDAPDATTGIAEHINLGNNTEYSESIYQKGLGVTKRNNGPDPYQRTSNIF